MNFFAPPLLGPFVEPSGRSDESSTGAAITWTSGSQAYRVDLVRLPARFIRDECLGFEQIPDLSLEEFLWHGFESNGRLPDFLNELRPFVRPSSGAPSPAAAGQWLNPGLVAKGFSLGNAKVRGGHTVRSQVIWVFGGDAAQRRSRSQYSLVGFIDWTPSGTTLLRHSHCWGLGAHALRRLLHQSVDCLKGAILTEAGEARMRQLLSWSRPVERKPKTVTLTESEKNTALHLRKSLPALSGRLSATLRGQIDRIPERAYAGILRTCVRQGLPQSARTLLLHRPLPVVGRDKLLEQFIDAHWVEIWKCCANEATPRFIATQHGYNALLNRVMETGECGLLHSVLDSLTAVPARVAQCLLEKAYQMHRADMFDCILLAPVVQPIREECLLGCFEDSLFEHRQSQSLALHLLEMGVRPFRAFKPDAAFYYCHWIYEDYNLPVLARALELEPPAYDTLETLFRVGRLRVGQAFDLLCQYSRSLPQHQDRMNRVASRAAVSFLWKGEPEALVLLNQAFQEGASLKGMPGCQGQAAKLLTGSNWREREGHWIDLIGLLLKAGRQEDADAIKTLKRPCPKAAAK